jgi:minor histocompatibility antigen H13
MLKNEPFRFIAIGILVALTLASMYVHISVTFMVVIHTILLVYLGSVYSSKIYDVSKEREIETMKQKDAWLFPVFGSAVLFGLFCLFKFFDKDLVNKLFHVYFSVIGAYSVAALIYERLVTIPTLEKLSRSVLFTVPTIPWVTDKPSKFDNLNALTWIVGGAVGIAYYLLKTWTLNNIIGIAFCIFGIENVMLGQFKVGFILLSLLFFYDIFWVFGTPVMVTVAKNLEGPIKLMFPKSLDKMDSVSDFNMIGLGDIVIPGVYVALMLRYDIFKFLKNNRTAMPFSFSNCYYFLMNMLGYSIGIISTIIVMVVFQAAQPALLYLVPGCLLFSIIPAYLNGDFNELWDYSEDSTLEELKKEDNKIKSN